MKFFQFVWLLGKMPPENLSDGELMRLYSSKGDTTYVASLFKRYVHLVYGVCLKYLKDEEKAKDTVMEIFGKLLQELSSANIENFKAWLYQVSKNECLMRIRKEGTKLKMLSNLEDFYENGMENNNTEHLMNMQDEEKKFLLLNQGIENLNDEQKLCITLFYFDGKSYQEIAQTTGFSEKQVKSYLQNGKRNLKNQLTANDEQE